MTTAPDQKYIYIVRSNTRDNRFQPDQWEPSDSKYESKYSEYQALCFYDDNALNPGSINHKIFKSVKDANHLAVELLRIVYWRREGDNFIARWLHEGKLFYEDGCLRMLGCLEKGPYDAFVRDFPYTVFVDKFSLPVEPPRPQKSQHGGNGRRSKSARPNK